MGREQEDRWTSSQCIWKNELQGKAKVKICGGWSTPAQISLPSLSHAYTHHLMQADGVPALMPSKQRPPMSRGLFSLLSVMLPCNTPGTKSLPSHRGLQSTDGHCSATAPQCSDNTFHCALEADLIYSAWLWITQTHFISSLPQCMLHSNSLKTVVNASGIFRTALYGWCVLLQHMSCLSIT